MGQQQLLLLVLSTVIVGLATVAGIQAFDENRQQAASDALSQEAATHAADVKGLYEKPAQFGGLDTTSATSSDVASRLGISGGSDVPAADGSCTVNSVSSGNSTQFQAVIKCEGGGEYGNTSFFGVFNPSNSPSVNVQTSSP